MIKLNKKICELKCVPYIYLLYIQARLAYQEQLCTVNTSGFINQIPHHHVSNAYQFFTLIKYIGYAQHCCIQCITNLPINQNYSLGTKLSIATGR